MRQTLLLAALIPCLLVACKASPDARKTRAALFEPTAAKSQPAAAVTTQFAVATPPTTTTSADTTPAAPTTPAAATATATAKMAATPRATRSARNAKAAASSTAPLSAPLRTARNEDAGKMRDEDPYGGSAAIHPHLGGPIAVAAPKMKDDKPF